MLVLSINACQNDNDQHPITFNLSFYNNLNKELSECSGIRFINEQFYIINDSGGGSKIYVLNKDGILINSLVVNNIENIDWEALAIYNNNLIVADIGNNFGDRKDQKLYEVNLEDTSNVNGEVLSDVTFPQQSNCTYRKIHNYDAEAVIAKNSFILLFTKNRANALTYIYELDLAAKEKGFFLKDSLAVPAPITDACMTSDESQLLLLSSSFKDPYFETFVSIVKITNNSFQIIENIPLEINGQAEGICNMTNNQYIICTEDEKKGTDFGQLFLLELSL